MMMMMMMMLILYAVSAEDIAGNRGHRVYLLPAVCYCYLPLVRSMSFFAKTSILVGIFTYCYYIIVSSRTTAMTFRFYFFPYHIRYIIIHFNICHYIIIIMYLNGKKYASQYWKFFLLVPKVVFTFEKENPQIVNTVENKQTKRRFSTDFFLASVPIPA